MTISYNDMAVYNMTVKLILIVLMFVTSFATAVTIRMNYMLGNGQTLLAKCVVY